MWHRKDGQDARTRDTGHRSLEIELTPIEYRKFSYNCSPKRVPQQLKLSLSDHDAVAKSCSSYSLSRASQDKRGCQSLWKRPNAKSVNVEKGMYDKVLSEVWARCDGAIQPTAHSTQPKLNQIYHAHISVSRSNDDNSGVPAFLTNVIQQLLLIWVSDLRDL